MGVDDGLGGMNRPIRVLHLSLTDGAGGADIAAYRIYESTRKAGADARIAVRRRVRAESEAVEIPLRRAAKAAASVMDFIAARVQKSSNPFHRSTNLVPTGGMSISGFEPDLVHLHWMGSNALSLGEISRIRVPVVWTLHDSWPFAGAEHHPSYPEDDRFVAGYQRSNRVHSSRVDVDGLVWKRKKANWHRKFHLVAPSTWMAEQTRRSLLMGDQPIVTIPNPLPKFPELNPAKAAERGRWGIGAEEFVVVTSGMGGTHVESKGWPILRDSLAEIARHGVPIHLLIIGQDHPPEDVPIGIRCSVTGVLKDSEQVGEALSCGDVFVTTSSIESFGLAAAEASAIGLPVIASASSGLLDVVEDGSTGWLVEPGNVQQLAGAIAAAHREPVDARLRGERGRERAQRLWSLERVGTDYRTLYERVVSDL